jgi:hypothetical protein
MEERIHRPCDATAFEESFCAYLKLKKGIDSEYRKNHLPDEKR